VIVELRTRKREMRGDGGDHHDKQLLKRIFCAGQFTIPDTACTSSDPACKYIDTRSSQPNQAKLYPWFLISASILHIVPIFIPHLSLSYPQLYHHRRTQSSVIPLYLSVSWSRVDTECSIHWAHHPPRIVCLHFISKISSWPLNAAWLWCASLYNRPPSASSPS